MTTANKLTPLAARYSDRTRQRGIVLPLVIIGLIAIIAMAGLAIDSSHAFVNKTRLQNMADAAALTAAKVYDETADTILSTAAANNNFGQNTNGSGNFEIDGEYDGGNISVVVQYSETLNPFVSSGIGPYVRVIATGFNMATGLASVVGINSINIAASAVAGPSPTIDYACNIAPMVACAAALPPPPPPGGEVDETFNYGFEPDTLMVLKPSPGDHDDIGPGNYKLLRLECAGGACVRDAMAGGYENCASTYEPVETEPGVTAGPTSQGFNTRFNQYAGPISPDDYPPDVIITAVDPPLDTVQQEELDPLTGELVWVDRICVDTCDCGTEEQEQQQVDEFGNTIVDEFGNPITITVTVAIKCNSITTPPFNVVEMSTNLEYAEEIFNHDEYVADTLEESKHLMGGEVGRRVLAMPVADCSGNESGQSTLNIVGFACYFMLQPIGGGQDKNIFGEFVSGCMAGGNSGMTPGATPGPYVIQLYKDPDSTDS